MCSKFYALFVVVDGSFEAHFRDVKDISVSLIASFLSAADNHELVAT